MLAPQRPRGQSLDGIDHTNATDRPVAQLPVAPSPTDRLPRPLLHVQSVSHSVSLEQTG